MLKQTQPTIRIFKLSTGEEIITKVVEEDLTTYIIEKPLQMGMGAKGPQFMPFMFMVNQDKTMVLQKDKVVITAPADANVETQYETLTTGIALPTKSPIITG